MTFLEYLKLFESDIVIKGVQKGVFVQKEVVPVRKGKLENNPFGRKVGPRFGCDTPLVIDYYGLLKKSSGFVSTARSLQRELRGKQVAKVEAVVVHFNSIKLEQIVLLAPNLAVGFPRFKKELLNSRGFNNKKGDRI